MDKQQALQTVQPLFKPFHLGSLTLPNRIVMAPMTRSFHPEDSRTGCRRLLPAQGRTGCRTDYYRRHGNQPTCSDRRPERAELPWR